MLRLGYIEEGTQENIFKLFENNKKDRLESVIFIAMPCKKFTHLPFKSSWIQLLYAPVHASQHNW